MASDGAAEADLVEMAWHVLAVLMRLDRPAAASELAAAARPLVVERLCSIPGSPLRLCDGGVVTVSEAAVLRLLRFMGLDVVVPRAWERRRWGEVTISYVRKRKRSDAGCFRAKRLQLLAPDADLVEHGEHESHQLVPHSSVSSAPGEVHLKVIQELQDRCPTLFTFFRDPSSIGFSTRGTLVPHSAKITMPCLQPKLDQPLRSDDGMVLENMVLALVANEDKNEANEDLNLICKIPDSPICSNSKTIEDIEAFDMIPNQADALKYKCQNAGHHENVPNCDQEENPLGISACGEVCEKETRILFQAPVDTETGFIVPQMSTNIGPAALPQGSTRYESMNKRNLNIAVEDRENKYLNHGEQTWNEAGVNVSKKGPDKMVVKQKEKSKKNGLPKEDKGQLAAKSQKNQVAPKPLPCFKGFVIEEEEGSGGYGTVYRAQRKKDGQIFAIKCPHPNAHSHHVNNELKMLERFGGKNCIIKYDCSLRSGDLESFVLEHVEHDRPEILKKDISVLELQWYGFCLFRALASLHKQEVVHRDVKPGNFLFSRKVMKGYLIDFNLAYDLHQKFLKNCKSETNSCGKDTVSQTSSNLSPVVHAKEAAPDSKQQPLPLKRKRSNRSPVGGAPNKVHNKSRQGGQAADVSGVTSAKDPTSTRTSMDKLKQPMPYKGRKELMNFLHEAMQSPNKNTMPAPVSQRKRVPAPFGSDRKLLMLTPMPLRSGASAVAGSGMFNNKGHGKHRREGPCVGTKGFRAPEVLFRSLYQGCKVDVWSAGVTLLYFIIGRAPFGGDPEQNIKEIAKLRGNEELWEVAKLHNCESLYPSDLFDIKSFHSVDLREWCAANTRRPDFLKMIPDSLFDLVDKCLSVNPRCRLTSEDALRHEFFAPCRDSLRKLRRPAVSDAACSSHQTQRSQQNNHKLLSRQTLTPAD